MKIVFFAPRFHTNQREIVKALLDRGHDVSYFVMFYGVTEDHSLLKTELIPSKTSKSDGEFLNNELEYIEKYPIDIIETKKVIKTKNPDLVIVRDRTKTMRAVNLICKSLGIPVILYDQRPLYVSKSGILGNLKRKIFNIATPSVRYTPVVYRACNIDNCKPEMTNIDNNAHYIPFIVSVPERKKTEYQHDGFLHIIDVGKYRESKNHSVLVEAIELCKYKNKIKVTIIGQAKSKEEMQYRDNLQKLIDNKGLEKNIILISNVLPNEMVQYYYQNDVFVLCSLNELASISVLEAMACGLSVLATFNNGTSSLISNNSTGMLFDPRDSNDLAKKIDCYFEECNRAERMGKNAKEYIIRQHSRVKYIEAMNNLLRDIRGDLKV